MNGLDPPDPPTPQDIFYLWIISIIWIVAMFGAGLYLHAH